MFLFMFLRKKNRNHFNISLKYVNILG